MEWWLFKQITEKITAAQLVPYKNENFDEAFVESLLMSESIDALNFMIINEKPIVGGFLHMRKLIRREKYQSVIFLLTETDYLKNFSPYDFEYHFRDVKSAEVFRTIFKETGWKLSNVKMIIRNFILGSKSNLAFAKFAVEEFGLTKEKITKNIEYDIIQCPLDVLKYLHELCNFDQQSLIDALKNYYEEGMSAEYYYLLDILSYESDLSLNVALCEDSSIEFIKEVCQNPAILDHFKKGTSWISAVFLKTVTFEIFQFAWENEFYSVLENKHLAYILGLFRRVDLFKYVMQFCGHNLDNALNFVRGVLGIRITKGYWMDAFMEEHSKTVYLDIIAEILAEYNIGMNELDRAIENKLWECAPAHIIDALPLDAHRLRHNNCNILTFALQGDNMYAVQKILAVPDIDFQNALRKMRPRNLTHTACALCAQALIT